MALSDILFQSGDGQEFLITSDDPGLNDPNDILFESGSSRGALVIVNEPNETLNEPDDIVFDEVGQMEEIAVPNPVVGQPRKVR